MYYLKPLKYICVQLSKKFPTVKLFNIIFLNKLILFNLSKMLYKTLSNHIHVYLDIFMKIKLVKSTLRSIKVN